MLTSILGFASTEKQSGSGEYFDDTVVTTKVKAVKIIETPLKSSEINVEIFKGMIQLSGFVRSQANIDITVETTGYVKGVNYIK